VDAFDACTELMSITVDMLDPNYTSRDGVLFDKEQHTLVQYPSGKVGSYSIPASVSRVGDFAFYGSDKLTSVILPSSVTSIGPGAFSSCTGLRSLYIGDGVTSIGDFAFNGSTGLTAVYFAGNPPKLGTSAFESDNRAIVYYLPRSTGWGATFGGLSTALWNPMVQTADANFGVRTNKLGFVITGTRNLVIVVEASTDLAHPAWTPVATNNLDGGSSYFSDPMWTTYSSRFYRLRSP